MPQDTYAAYIIYKEGNIPDDLVPIDNFHTRYKHDPIAAPTAAEIGKWLPLTTFDYAEDDGSDAFECDVAIQYLPSGLWNVAIYDVDEGSQMWAAWHANMAEVLSITLLHLVQRGLVTFDKQEAGADA